MLLDADFNPPTPCGVGRIVASFILLLILFQSTHPVWGGTSPCRKNPASQKFQSTHPVWGGTKLPGISIVSNIFQSTHPVWGGTADLRISAKHLRDFNPPTPCGVGPVLFSELHFAFDISIHPPRVGWDGP